MYVDKNIAKFCGTIVAPVKRRQANTNKIDWETTGPEIAELAKSMCASNIAKKLGISDGTVRKYAEENNIKLSKSKYNNGGAHLAWTKEEDQFIITHYGRNIEWICQQLDRSYRSVANRACELRKAGIYIPYAYGWTPEEEQILRENPTLSVAELAKLLPKRTVDGIRSKRNKM